MGCSGSEQARVRGSTRIKVQRVSSIANKNSLRSLCAKPEHSVWFLCDVQILSPVTLQGNLVRHAGKSWSGADEQQLGGCHFHNARKMANSFLGARPYGFILVGQISEPSLLRRFAGSTPLAVTHNRPWRPVCSNGYIRRLPEQQLPWHIMDFAHHDG
jgi:hypothetical protein